MKKCMIFVSGVCAITAVDVAIKGEAWQVLWFAFLCGMNLWGGLKE